jgi:hypothetical protein
VFFGTTNKRDFLSDPSGNRRFLPVDLDKSKATKNIFEITDREVGQIWAEAVQFYKAGEKLYLTGEAEEQSKTEQKRHSESDERIGLIYNYLEIKLPEDWSELDIYKRREHLTGGELIQEGTITRKFVCVAEIWCECLGKGKEDMDRYKTREINDILRGLEGWEQSKSTKNFAIYGKQKYYSRIKL